MATRTSLPLVVIGSFALIGAAVADAQPRPGAPARPPASAAASGSSSSAKEPPKETSNVSAVPSTVPNPTPEDLSRAKAVFDAGGRAFDQGDFSAAIQAFQQAYSLSGRPSVLFSLAQAHRKRSIDTGSAGDRDAAIALYRAYLAAVKTGGRRADAVKGLEALNAGNVAPSVAATAAPVVRKTQLAIDSSTPGALISIDGGAALPPQVMTEVKPGRHTVKVVAPGHIEKEFVTQAVDGQITPETYELEEQPAKLAIEMPSDATIYVNGRDMGKSSQLTLPSGSHFVSVVRLGHQSEARPIEMAPGQTQKLTFDLTTTTQRDVSIGFLVGGAAVALGGGGLLAAAFVRQADAQDIQLRRESGSISPADLAEYDAARKDRDLLRASGLLVGGVGGLGVLVGAALFLLDSPPPAQPPSDAVVEKKKKEEKRRETPSEMEQMRLVPWALPESGGGVAFGGLWTSRF